MDRRNTPVRLTPFTPNPEVTTRWRPRIERILARLLRQHERNVITEIAAAPGKNGIEVRIRIDYGDGRHVGVIAANPVPFADACESLEPGAGMLRLLGAMDNLQKMSDDVVLANGHVLRSAAESVDAALFFVGTVDGEYVNVGEDVVGLIRDLLAPGANNDVFIDAIPWIPDSFYEDPDRPAENLASIRGVAILIETPMPKTLVRAAEQRDWLYFRETGFKGLAEEVRERGFHDPIALDAGELMPFLARRLADYALDLDAVNAETEMTWRLRHALGGTGFVWLHPTVRKVVAPLARAKRAGDDQWKIAGIYQAAHDIMSVERAATADPQ